jgi:alkylhydroperoxidase family enzyme
MTAADVEALRAFYNDAQIIERVYTAAFYNSVTRWTDSTGIPQDENFRDHKIQLETPTAELWSGRKSLVVGEPRPERPALEDRSAAEQAMAAAERRAPLVALTPADDARAIYGDLFPDKIPQWALAWAAFPQVAKLQATAMLEIERDGRSDPLLRAQLAWTSARRNRAWYALAAARDRLLAQGQSLDDIFRLDEPDSAPPGRREALRFARKLTVRPQGITDDDVAALRAHFSDQEVAEIIYTLCAANQFDRFTETLQLSAN